ncbi:hypothetical protein DdX_18210 [Ditylenchus destructor]|uniref:Uncharacterized protein n=1 Tax=Ditylenchus destructor TaxID=166010 RepID=A0AAD4MK55_9BILA|nr:hypothetical protein DdX_18210 [Ditylenchus destructor]
MYSILLSVSIFSAMLTECCKKSKPNNGGENKKECTKCKKKITTPPVVEQPIQESPQSAEEAPAEDTRINPTQQVTETKPKEKVIVVSPRLYSRYAEPPEVKTEPTQLDSFQKPEDDDKMADAKDPNYRSFKGIGNEIFIKRDQEEKKTMDDNQYVALANLNEVAPTPIIDSKKGKGRDDQAEQQADNPAPKKRTVFKRPEMGKVSAKNPQYETLANLDDGIFKNKE